MGTICACSLQYDNPYYHNFSSYLQVFKPATYPNSLAGVLDVLLDNEDFDVVIDQPSKALKEVDHGVVYSMVV